MRGFLFRLVGLTAALVAVPAGSASAGMSHGLVYRESTTTVNSDSFWSDSASCPDPRVGISGGGQVVGAFGQNFLGGSFPAGHPRTRWTTRGLNEEGNGKHIKTFAICARPALDPTYVTKTIQVNSMGTIIGSAQCPKGREVIGGGVRVVGDSSDSVFSYPIDAGGTGSGTFTRWTGYVYDTSLGGPQTVKIYAVCVPKSTGLHYESEETTLPAGVDSSTPVVFPCPLASEAAVAGGGSIQGGPSTSHFAGSFPRDTAVDVDRIPDNAWELQAANDSAAQRTITSYLVCKP